MLTISNLTKTYRQRGIVLDNLDLEVREGETVSITGPSGSGKTTLLNITGLLDKPDSGEVLFMGEKILDYDQEESAFYRNRHIGFVFQDHLLLPYLTVKENILLPLLPSRLSDSDYEERLAYAESLMQSVGITDLADKYPYGISVGEAQRTAIVRALINKPRLLLADEPTGSLDRKNAENLGDILLKMNSDHGVTIILATHSASLAAKMGTRLKLSEGKLIPADN